MRAPGIEALALLGAIALLTLSAPPSARALQAPDPGALAGEACNLAGQVPALGAGAKDACEALVVPLRLPEWLAAKGWGALGSLLGGVPKQLAGAVQKVVEYGANTVLNGVSGWVASGAVFLVSRVADAIDKTTTPQVSSGWFSASYATLARIAFTLALPLLFFALARALFLRDLSELARSVLVYLPLSALLTGAAVAVTQMALVVTDGLSLQAAGLAGSQPHAFFAQAAKGLVVLGAGGAASGSPALPGFVVALLALVAAICAFVLWLELILRGAAIYVVLVFLPLAFVCLIWPTTARLARRMVELLGALIASKLLIVTIIALAASALLHGGLGGSIEAALAGVVLMALAIWAPWTLMRLIPLMEAAVAHHEPVSSQARALTVERMRPAELVKRAFGDSGAAGLTAEPYGSGTQGQGAASASTAEGAAGYGRAAAAGASGGAAGGVLAAGIVAKGVAKRRAQSSGTLASVAGADGRASEASVSGSAGTPTAAADDTATIRGDADSAGAAAVPETTQSRERGAHASAPADGVAAPMRGAPSAPRVGDAEPAVDGASASAPRTIAGLGSSDGRVPASAGPPAVASTVAPELGAQREPPLRHKPLPPTPPSSAGLMAPAAQGTPRAGAPAGEEPTARSAQASARLDPNELVPEAEADDGR